MTGDQWLACTEPIRMLEFLRDSGISATDRRLRLFAAACCRRAWYRLDGGARAAVETSERCADGAATEKELMAAVWANRSPHDIDARAAVDSATVGGWRPAVVLLAAVCSQPPGSGPSPADSLALAQEQGAQAALLRDVIGNPLPTLVPAVLTWNAGLIVQLARSAYDERLLPSGQLDPARLALLADALTDAGCQDTDLLGHLRGPAPHIRGCWAVDVILAKDR